MYNYTMARAILKQNKEEGATGHVLKVSDRCDQCNAQAFILVKGSTGELMFCGHHYEKIMNNPDAYTKMMSFMFEVIDERDKLIQNRSQGESYS